MGSPGTARQMDWTVQIHRGEICNSWDAKTIIFTQRDQTHY